MRLSSNIPSSDSSSSGRLEDELARIVHQIHKTSTILNIANDSGISFSGQGSSGLIASPVRQATGSSIASTITPESAPARSDTVTLDSSAPAPSASAIVDPSRNNRPSGLPILATFDTSSPLPGSANVVDSPSVLKANEPFFSEAAGPAYSLSPSSSQDFELNALWDSLARELKPIADILRSGRHRTPLGTSRLPADCVSALQLWLCTGSSPSKQPPNSHALEAAIEIFRVLANLCIDHDANRSLLDALNAAPTVLAAVSAVLRKQEQSRSSALFSVKILTFLRAAMGAVLNMQLEHIATKQSLANAECIRVLTRVASHERVYLPHVWAEPLTVEMENDAEAVGKMKMGATVSSWAWRVVQEIFDDAKEEKEGDVSTPSDEEDEERGGLGGTRDVRGILARKCFDELLRPLSFYIPKEEGKEGERRLELDTDDVEELVDSDAEILQTIGGLLETCAVEEHVFRQRAVRTMDSEGEAAAKTWGLDSLMSFVERAQLPREWVRDFPSSNEAQSSEDAAAADEMRKAFGSIKASAARAVVAISGDDSNMVILFDSAYGFIHRLKTWIRYDPKTRDDLVSCGMLALGNLARSDAHCLSLVQEHELAPFLAALLRDADDIKVAHGLVSLLKNLSIPAANKRVIGELGVVDAVVRFMGKDKDMVQPLQFATVGLLKHLCSGVGENAVRLVEGAGLNAVVDMIRRVDDVPTKMEATRVLVNVVKSLWNSASRPSSELSEETLFSARKKLVRRDVIQSLAEMVRTSPKYPVLVNEGIIALTLVGSERMGAELVSLSLLTKPTKPTADEEEDEEMASDSEAAALRAPRRRSTVDSSASTSSHPLPPPACALDMVNLVLARRDARMPPQFASNACALAISLCRATTAIGEGESRGAVGQEAVKKCLTQTKPVLERLKDCGPIEALAAAAEALEGVSRVTAS
ncbi:uncharacterized protein UHO2_03370 [Ustilago hordei]|uniref:Uncharacterized protein n=1 Tax=Ustilago hordei TaxID=120017 RepID=I2G193_USTHO|nr:uncharacterized protein UHO2_03370 [Ustilago hordei]CCF52936.1 uncharacterized protein UHOR_04308 [Ustilago hordei]SYW84173.1 uncharacterized protein UHO2_03370 [Ustilago hordei]